MGLSTPAELGKLFEELATTLSPASRIQHLAFEGALMAIPDGDIDGDIDGDNGGDQIASFIS